MSLQRSEAVYGCGLYSPVCNMPDGMHFCLAAFRTQDSIFLRTHRWPFGRLPLAEAFKASIIQRFQQASFRFSDQASTCGPTRNLGRLGASCSPILCSGAYVMSATVLLQKQRSCPALCYRTPWRTQRVQVPNRHSWYGFWDQRPQMLGTWTLWVTARYLKP